MTATVTPHLGEVFRAIADPKVAAETFKDDASVQNWQKDLDAATDAHDLALVNRVKDEMTASVAELLKEDVKRLPMEGDRKGYNRQAPGAAVEGICDSSGEFFQAIYHNQKDAGLRAKAQQILSIQNSMSEKIPADGGFLLQESTREEFMGAALELEVVRPRATVIPMATSRVKLPVIDSTSNASTLFGGITTYWTSEEATISDSQPKFGQVILDSQKFTAATYVSAEMIQDSAISVAGILNNLVPKAIAFGEDVKFIGGNGVGEPLGFLNANCLVSVAKETLQPADTIVWQNLVGMVAQMLPGSYANAVWIANPNTMKELGTMALNVGLGGSAVWLQNGANALPQTILGRPLLYSEKMATLGDKGDIALVDLSYYLIGDRMQMQAATSVDYAFLKDQITYRFIERLDGRPLLLDSITPYKGTAKLSAFVTLDARA